MSHLNKETILSVHHWTDKLFSFTCTRSDSFRFLNGQFTMVGLEVNNKPLLRAYSLVSANYETNLEFFSIKIPEGPLTQRLQHVQAGDPILVSAKATGTLIVNNLTRAKNLWLIATGTGLAPFISIIKDPETYENFDHIILTHTCRYAAELAYKEFIVDHLPKHEYIGDLIREKLIYFPTVTRDEFETTGRITHLIESGKLFGNLNQLYPFLKLNAGFEQNHDRIMVCGSSHFLKDFTQLLPSNFVEGNYTKPGDFVLERAFVD